MATIGVAKSNLPESKPNKLGKIEEPVDRISNLPDAIIHHIFSFISTIDVVRTSVLAKRWRYIWTQTTNLLFDDGHVPNADRYDAFIHFVNGVICLHKAPRIEKYCVFVQQPSNAAFVDDWIHFALHKNVNELHVKLNADMVSREPFEMPHCGSLRELRLQLGGRGLRLPTTGHFSALETLSLSNISCIGNLEKISQQCPRLKSLRFSNCIGLDCLTVNCPLLEDLEIIKCEGLIQLNVSALKLRTLTVHDSFTYGRCSINILAPSLQSFDWLDYIVGKFSIGGFTSLKFARISLIVDYGLVNEGLYLKSAGNFLKSLACAESIAVEIACFWGVSTNRELLEGLTTPLYNLKHMKLLVGFDVHVFRGISYLFKSCPNLKTLETITIDEKTHKQLESSFPGALDGSEHWVYESQPLLHLREAKVCGFRGKEHEIEFVDFLLKNSVVLKRMNVIFSSEVSFDQNAKAVITRRLMETKCASLDAVIRVS